MWQSALTDLHLEQLDFTGRSEILIIPRGHFALLDLYFVCLFPSVNGS